MKIDGDLLKSVTGQNHGQNADTTAIDKKIAELEKEKQKVRQTTVICKDENGDDPATAQQIKQEFMRKKLQEIDKQIQNLEAQKKRLEVKANKSEPNRQDENKNIDETSLKKLGEIGQYVDERV